MTEASVTSVVEVDIKGGPTPHAPPSRADPGDVPKTSTKEMMAIFFISIGLRSSACCAHRLLQHLHHHTGRRPEPASRRCWRHSLKHDRRRKHRRCHLPSDHGLWLWRRHRAPHLDHHVSDRGWHVRRHVYALEAAQVLIGSKQCTDQLRAKISKPFQMKYLHTIQCIFQAIAFIIALIVVSGTTFPWGCIMSLLASICYGVNIALVFRHFKQPGVPQSLNLGFGEAGEQIVASQKASDSKVASIEKRVADLEAKVKLLMEKA